ncbi:hypothetical protein C7212DRAFT_283440 [Tuber magnatum]|uniref:Uncharacterized protein n=1 Tax=Tuber magnatum TaxID=42249 RepID=A0A317SJ56_9PEZI|nr:hypothetical protein C7212DRAFT_283440 [Tuber magnatum]
MHLSTRIIATTFLILTSPLLNSPIQARAAYYTEFSLRIEGPNTTIFENIIRTSGHIVTAASGGTHMCDGTNNGANDKPGGTITSAIDDAVLTWDGTWDKQTQEYLITSIAGYVQTENKYWGLLVGKPYKFTDKGGCQTKVTEGEEVLIAFDAFGASAFLKASADLPTVKRGDNIVVTVVNGVDEKPVKDAVVLGMNTNGEGKVTIKFERSVGVHKFKATKLGAIRSNEIIVTVTPKTKNSPGCTNE